MEKETLTESETDSISPGSSTSQQETGFQKIAPQDRKFECSTSLSMIQIVEKYEEESEQWEMESNLGLVKGRSIGEGEPVYFLNGAGLKSIHYSPVAWLLKDHYKCVLFDSPLYFPQTCRRSKVSIESLSQMVREISDDRKDNQVTLFGSSFGSMIVLNSLSRYPDQFIRGIIQGGYSHRKLSLTEKTMARIGRLLPGTLGHIPSCKKIQEINHRLWLPLMDQGRWEFYQKHSAAIPVKTLSDQVKIMGKTDISRSLPEIKQPVLLIRTEGEGAVLEQCQEELEKSLPNSTTEWIHSCGLLPSISRPHAIAKLIRNYV